MFWPVKLDFSKYPGSGSSGTVLVSQFLCVNVAGSWDADGPAFGYRPLSHWVLPWGIPDPNTLYYSATQQNSRLILGNHDVDLSHRRLTRNRDSDWHIGDVISDCLKSAITFGNLTPRVCTTVAHFVSLSGRADQRRLSSRAHWPLLQGLAWLQLDRQWPSLCQTNMKRNNSDHFMASLQITPVLTQWNNARSVMWFLTTEAEQVWTFQTVPNW